MTAQQGEQVGPRNYTVGYAKAELEGLFGDAPLTDALAESWLPGRAVTRYGRRWYLSRITGEDPEVRFGRIGFVNENELATLRFDPTQLDFIRGEAPAGIIVPFGISTRTGIISFQIRSGTVRETTFTGALQALLNGSIYAWVIRALAQVTSYESWRPRMQRLTAFDLRLERPNPHYHGNEIAERLLQEVRLEYARLAGAESSDEGIDAESELFTQALDHVLRDYGRASLRGVDRFGRESTWVKLKGVVGSVTSKRTYPGFGGDEAPETVLRQALEQPPPGAQPVAVSEATDDDPSVYW